MTNLEITKELKYDIELNQTRIQNTIRNHQICVSKFKDDPDNGDLQNEINKAEELIISLGYEQKKLLERLRDEYNTHQKALKGNFVKNAIEERRFNLSNALNRARKQNISLIRSSSVNSFSDESDGRNSIHSSPEHHPNPLEPQDVTQEKFLSYFCLATHEVYKEMQNKRAERKRRSTANPQFLYGKGWDFFSQPKRKRSAFLARPISPPNTRQATRKKQMRVSPPSSVISTSSNNNLGSGNKMVTNGSNVTNDVKTFYSSFSAIPNLPSGLVIERVSPESGSPDSKSCITCKQPGALTVCDTCSNGFHISCHNRPLTQSPRHCPRCIGKEKRTLNVPSGMSVSYVSPAEVSAKLEEKRKLEEMKQSLTAELTQLQNRHSQLTVSLKNQKTEQDELLLTQQATEVKVKQLLDFIDHFKKPVSENDSS